MSKHLGKNKQDERRIGGSSEEKFAVSNKKRKVITNVLPKQHEQMNWFKYQRH
jgi:hypothetical protein